MNFIEVMIEQKRMCDTVGDCDNCPLEDFYCSPNECHNVNELHKYANLVISWAHEHPRYPTIGEFFDSIKIAMGYADDVKFDTIADCFIPQNIAREFGIMPIHMKYEKGEWTP